jgi:transcriptional regulator with XRE-family HTH domain
VKEGIGKSPDAIGLMCRFVREKRGLSQKEVAETLKLISRATVAFAEVGNAKKVSVKNYKSIFQSLRLNIYSLHDPSLFEYVRNDNEMYRVFETQYGAKTEIIVKVYCAVFDSYAALLWWKYFQLIALDSPFHNELKSKSSKTETSEKEAQPPTEYERFKLDTHFPDYLPAIIIYDVLKTLPENVLLDIFKVEETSLAAPLEKLQEELFKDLTIRLSVDPFTKFMWHLRIPFVDYFGLIHEIINTITPIRLWPFPDVETKMMELINELTALIFKAGDRRQSLGFYVHAIRATRDDVAWVLKVLEERTS